MEKTYKVGDAVCVIQKISDKTSVHTDGTIIKIDSEQEKIKLLYYHGESQKTCWADFSEIQENLMAYGVGPHIPPNTFRDMMEIYGKRPYKYKLQLMAMAMDYEELCSQEIEASGKPSETTLDHLERINKLLRQIR